MTDKRKRSLILSSEEKTMLEKISKSRLENRARVERAQYLLSFISGETISSLARIFQTNRPKVQRVIDKAIAYGVTTALDDLPGRGRKSLIGEKDKAWILSLACQKPRVLGYPKATWTMQALAQHIQNHCLEVNAPALKHLSRGTVHKIFSQSNIKPHKVRPSRELTDPECERKMNAVLHLYKEAEIRREAGDDGAYPPDETIKIILDNHSAHTSQKTQAYLKRRGEDGLSWCLPPNMVPGST
ncbi:MAG: helix-turn-helix domain-containing protein [Candidatus Atribacteria bacterium]|nr:helix-turn-helix domain-containing protein [Candidatus Atribacteria bacterium]